jgi:peptidoglycan lytic transglycosylase D
LRGNSRRILHFFLILAFVLPGCIEVTKPVVNQDRDALNRDLAGLLTSPDTPTTQPPVDQPIPQTEGDLLVPDNPEMREHLARIAGPSITGMINTLQRSGPYHRFIADQIEKHGLPPGLIAVVMQESAFKPKAVSKSGAAGLWQFMPATGRMMGLRTDAFVDEKFDPIRATEAALDYLEQLHEQFNDWPLTLAAYNWGKGSISRLLESNPGADFWELSRAGLVREETKHYVPGILARLATWRNPGRLGLDPAPDPPMEIVELPPLTDLRKLEKATGLEAGRLSLYAAHLRSQYIPAYRKPQRLLVDRDAAEAIRAVAPLEDFVASPDRLVGVTQKIHRIKRGQSLWRIASDTNTTLASLLDFNGWDKAPELSPGDPVVIYLRGEY